MTHPVAGTALSAITAKITARETISGQIASLGSNSFTVGPYATMHLHAAADDLQQHLDIWAQQMPNVTATVLREEAHFLGGTIQPTAAIRVYVKHAIPQEKRLTTHLGKAIHKWRSRRHHRHTGHA